jgi:hypothetical protein
MSKRFFILLLLLAALFTAATYLYTTETEGALSNPDLSNTVQTATVHGWPWGYYAQVTELTKVGERSVAVLEYNDLRWKMLGQTYAVWFVALLVLTLVLFIVTDPGRKPD